MACNDVPASGNAARVAVEDGRAVSIDDNEGHYSKVVMDEVFGRNNFVANCLWQGKQRAHGCAGILALLMTIYLSIKSPLIFCGENIERPKRCLIQFFDDEAGKYLTP